MKSTIWNGAGNIPMPPRVLKFLKDYRDLCMKHGLALSHEDAYGAFVIERCDEALIEWAEEATLGNIE